MSPFCIRLLYTTRAPDCVVAFGGFGTSAVNPSLVTLCSSPAVAIGCILGRIMFGPINTGYPQLTSKRSNSVKSRVQRNPNPSLTNLTTMAPNLAHSNHDLIQSMISSKLQDGNGPTDDEIAKIAHCTPRTVRSIRRNLRLFGSTKAPSNGAGRPETITHNMLTALCS